MFCWYFVRSSMFTLCRVRSKCYFGWALTSLFIKWWHPAIGMHEPYANSEHIIGEVLYFLFLCMRISIESRQSKMVPKNWTNYDARNSCTKNNGSNNFGMHESIHQWQIKEDRSENDETKRSFMWRCDTLCRIFDEFSAEHAANQFWNDDQSAVFFLSFFLVLQSNFFSVLLKMFVHPLSSYSACMCVRIID